jgi:hypothetical protein
MRRRDAVISLPMSRAGSQARSFFYDVLIAAADRRPRGENSGLLCGGYPPQNRCPASEVPGQETNRRAWQRRIGAVNQIELGGLADCDLADNGCSPPPQAVLSSIATSSSYSLVIRTPLGPSFHFRAIRLLVSKPHRRVPSFLMIQAAHQRVIRRRYCTRGKRPCGRQARQKILQL